MFSNGCPSILKWKCDENKEIVVNFKSKIYKDKIMRTNDSKVRSECRKNCGCKKRKSKLWKTRLCATVSSVEKQNRKCMKVGSKKKVKLRHEGCVLKLDRNYFRFCNKGKNCCNASVSETRQVKFECPNGTFMKKKVKFSCRRKSCKVYLL